MKLIILFRTRFFTTRCYSERGYATSVRL